MDLTTPTQGYRTLQVRVESAVCHIRMSRPEAGNAINRDLIEDMARALRLHEDDARIVVLEGMPDVFCQGADFEAIQRGMEAGTLLLDQDPEPLYDLWRRLACGPFVSVAHVRGKVNAGGVGFAAACDVVLSEDKAVFSLSEMLFGLFPACVLPFLARRIGFARANYLTLTTQPLSARQAEQWGLVDACEENSDALLRKHLVRLKRLTKPAIVRYKEYSREFDESFSNLKSLAVRANVEIFSDPVNLKNIGRYVTEQRFPWETGS